MLGLQVSARCASVEYYTGARLIPSTSAHTDTIQDSWTDQHYLSLQYSWSLPCIAEAAPRAGLSKRVLKHMILGLKKIKISKSANFCFLSFQKVQMLIFYRFFLHLRNDILLWITNCGVRMAESLLVGCNFVSGICNLKPKNLLKNLKTYFCKKKLVFLPALPFTRLSEDVCPYGLTNIDEIWQGNTHL